MEGLGFSAVSLAWMLRCHALFSSYVYLYIKKPSTKARNDSNRALSGGRYR